MLIHPLGLVRTFPHICTVLQQFVSYEQPRSAPVSGRELLTIGYLQALPWPGFVSLMDSLSQVSTRSEEHTSELQSQSNLVCRLLLEKKNKKMNIQYRLHAYY